MADQIKLRGHHLLCILTYKGEGYTPEFVGNFDAIADRINKGAEIEVVKGIDDICGALRQGAEITCHHAKACRGPGVKYRDALALADVARVLQIPLLRKGEVLVLKQGEIKYLRRYFLHGANRRACTACSWHDFCTDIAKSGFTGVKLLPNAIP